VTRRETDAFADPKVSEVVVNMDRLEIIVGHCLAHSRRRFVEVRPNFPEECRFVLERFPEVYVNDALAREQNMTAEQRLAFHQTHSGPVMKQLKAWLKA
jgi:hypothetical protein